MTISYTVKVQLWTMNNYHYYLKSEFFPPRVTDAVPRFSCVKWHPEKDNVLYLAGQGECAHFVGHGTVC